MTNQANLPSNWKLCLEIDIMERNLKFGELIKSEIH